MDKPLELYRGVSINYENLEKFKFSGVDMFPPEPPIKDVIVNNMSICPSSVYL